VSKAGQPQAARLKRLFALTPQAILALSPDAFNNPEDKPEYKNALTAELDRALAAMYRAWNARDRELDELESKGIGQGSPEWVRVRDAAEAVRDEAKRLNDHLARNLESFIDSWPEPTDEASATVHANALDRVGQIEDVFLQEIQSGEHEGEQKYAGLVPEVAQEGEPSAELAGRSPAEIAELNRVRGELINLIREEQKQHRDLGEIEEAEPAPEEEEGEGKGEESPEAAAARAIRDAHFAAESKRLKQMQAAATARRGRILDLQHRLGELQFTPEERQANVIAGQEWENLFIQNEADLKTKQDALSEAADRLELERLSKARTKQPTRRRGTAAAAAAMAAAAAGGDLSGFDLSSVGGGGGLGVPGGAASPSFLSPSSSSSASPSLSPSPSPSPPMSSMRGPAARGSPSRRVRFGGEQPATPSPQSFGTTPSPSPSPPMSILTSLPAPPPPATVRRRIVPTSVPDVVDLT
jgi:hypothetical protein